MSTSGEGEFWLIVLIRVLRECWRLVLVLTVIGLLIGVSFGLLMKPVFEASIVMVPSAEQQSASPLGGLLGDIGGLASLAGGLSQGGDKNEALALLRSRAFTEKFIVAENLLPVLFPDEWSEDGGDDIPTLYDAYTFFDTEIRTISENITEGTITMSVAWYDRFEAAEWANILVTRLNEYMRQRKIAEANQTLAYLNKELEKTSVVELRQVIFGLIQENIRTITVANVRKEYAFRVIDPAAPSDQNAYIRPQRAILILTGTAVGFLFGLFIAFTSLQLKAAERK